jgi:hypothetical protein
LELPQFAGHFGLLEQQSAMAQRQAFLEARCRGYGFELKTPGFAQCMMKLDQAERQAAQAQSKRKYWDPDAGLPKHRDG